MLALICLLGLSACKKEASPSDAASGEPAKEAADDAQKDTAKADEKKGDEVPKGDAAKAEDNKADASNAEAAEGTAVKELGSIRLILPASFSSEGKELDVEKAAAGFENTIIKSFGSKDSDKKWSVRLDKVDDVMGESSYIFHAAQSESNEFEPTLIGAISMKGRVYSYNKEADSWTMLGMMPK